MCVGCFSTVDTVGVGAAAAAIVVTNGARRLRDRLLGIGSFERQQRTYIRNQAFMREIGLDAAAVLGPPPDGTLDGTRSAADLEPTAAGSGPSDVSSIRIDEVPVA